MLERYNLRELVSMLPVVVPDIEKTTDGWRVARDGISINLKIMTKNYPTLMDPDLCVYKFWRFTIPNPFDDYWKLANRYDL